MTARLLHYLYPYKWEGARALVVILVNVPLAAAGPLLTKAAIDLFILPDSTKQPSSYILWIKKGADILGLGGSRHEGLVFIAILFLSANLIQSVLQYLRTLIAETTGQNAVYDLRQEIFRRLQKAPVQFYDRTPAGRLMTRLTTDVDVLLDVLNSGIVAILGHALAVVYTLGWMFRLNVRLSLFSCLILLLIAAWSGWFRSISRPAFRKLRERISELGTFLQERLALMHVVQIFNCEKQEMDRFELLNHGHYQAAMSAMLRTALFYPAIETMLSIGMALILWYGGGHVIQQIMTLGSLVAFMQFAQSFYDPIAEISSRYPMLQAALASAENIFALLDELVVTTNPDKPARLHVVRGRIEFRNVWFAYEGEDWILKNISFIVEAGEKAAFVGRTGAGKTTITSLLLRFYDIQRGQILLDDVDIREINLEELRSSFAVVPQDIALFPRDIASNIGLGTHSILYEKVRDAARAVHINEFILSLEKGYQTEILGNSAGFSAGQRQLIGFARALAFERPVLVLDEATSSVDPETEMQVRNAVGRAMAARTSLVIAHRLSTIQSMDKIFVVHDGTIREAGDHKTLLARRGLYWMLYQLHFHSPVLPSVLQPRS
ncbi:MAG: ABC transporter ATP-binding protein/permease [Acidobacteriia bacterium]|nr:ABC transporter ATP-binding protein/permease [Terriglobia bacterium]